MAEHPVLAWLEAELARVEAAARAAGGGEIEAVDYLWGTKYLDVRQPDGAAKQTTEFSAELADHFAANNPAAVLRRVAADRQILAEHAKTAMGGCAACADTRHPDPRQWALIVWPCRTVRLLAEAYGWTEEAS